MDKTATRKQSGFTLIELMIGMAVGLIVLSGALYLYLQIFRASQTTLASTQLNRELGILVDTMSGEIRRHGYFATSGANPYQASSSAGISISGSCILYGYDVNADGVQNDNEFRGFKFDLQKLWFARTATAACDSATGWEEFSSTDSILVESLLFNLNIDAHTTGSSTSYTRKVEMTVTAKDHKGITSGTKSVSILIPNNVVVN